MLLLAWPVTASAHPLGNFTVNRYSRLELRADQVRVLYVVDMAEISAFQERQRMDTDHNGVVSAGEEAAYLASEVPQLAANLHLSLDGAALVLTPQDHTLAWLPGQGGLQTLRIEMHLTAAMPRRAAPWQGAYRDDNYAGRLGWQEIVVRAGDAVEVLGTTALTQEASQQLRVYPQDMLQSPLAMNQATFNFAPASLGQGTGPAGNARVARGNTGIGGRDGDAFTGLISVVPLGAGGLLLAFMAAFGWGALHALTPGHGKTVVAAYLVGSRGTTRHALFLGLTTTITHTAGVFAVGLLTLFASHFVVPERVYPWLEIISGLLVVGIGLALFSQRLRGLLAGDVSHAGHSHGHVHGHNHSHAGASTISGHGYLSTGSGGNSAHWHTLSIAGPGRPGRGSGQAAPWAPPGTAPAEVPHTGHAPEPARAMGGTGLTAGSSGAHAHVQAHLPPGAHGEPITWRGLLALGVSGGLLPCPSALVVMLSAIALNRVLFGLALIVAFSIGLASILTTIGVLFVHAGRFLARGESRLGYTQRSWLGRARLLLPVLSALIIAAAGAAITWQALPAMLR